MMATKSQGKLLQEKVAHSTHQQEKSLSKWERQKREWARMGKVLAKKIGKDPSETLVGTVWKWREKQEEQDMIDASVPQSVRGGYHSWEMGLRGGATGAGGVRYVRAGGTFPYPLYCPVKDRDHQLPDSNTFMRVITEEGYQQRQKLKEATGNEVHKKSIQNNEYYKDMSRKYKQHIEKRFPHRLHGVAEPFSVRGVPPPISTVNVDPVTEDDIPDEGVQYIAAVPSARSPSSCDPHSRLGSPISDRDKSVATPSVHNDYTDETLSGVIPQLTLDTQRLNFFTSPNTLSQQSLHISNPSEVAVFYSWQRLQPIHSIVPHVAKAARAEKFPQYFVLSELMEGVLLPEEDKTFTFGFTQGSVGIYTEDWLLGTIPKLVQGDVVIRLKGTVTSTEEDPMGRSILRNNMNSKINVSSMRELFTRMFNTEDKSRNVMLQTDTNMQHKATAQAIEAKASAAEQTEHQCFQNWQRHNGHFGCNYFPSLYSTYEQLHDSVQRYLVIAGNPAGTGMGITRAENNPEFSIPKWNGSIHQFLEVVSQMHDRTIQEEVLSLETVLNRSTQLLYPNLLEHCTHTITPTTPVPNVETTSPHPTHYPETMTSGSSEPPETPRDDSTTPTSQPKQERDIATTTSTTTTTVGGGVGGGGGVGMHGRVYNIEPEIRKLISDYLRENAVGQPDLGNVPESSRMETSDKKSERSERSENNVSASGTRVRPTSSKSDKDNDKHQYARSPAAESTRSEKPNFLEPPAGSGGVTQGGMGSPTTGSTTFGIVPPPTSPSPPLTEKELEKLEQQQIDSKLFELEMCSTCPTATMKHLITRGILRDQLGKAVDEFRDRVNMLQVTLGMIDEPMNDHLVKNAKQGKDKKLKKEAPKKGIGMMKGALKVNKGFKGQAGTQPGGQQQQGMDQEELTDDELRQRLDHEYRERMDVEARTVVLDCIDNFLQQVEDTEIRCEALIKTDLAVSYRQRMLRQEHDIKQRKAQGEEIFVEDTLPLALYANKDEGHGKGTKGKKK